MTNSRVQKNIQVLKKLKSKTGGVPNEELSEYTGWGGLKDAFSEREVYAELKALLGEDELASLKQTVSSAYYSPSLLVKFMWACLENRLGFRGGEILEPSAGTGIFIDSMNLKIKGLSNIDAVEIDNISAEMLIRKHPYINVIRTGFENCYFGSKRYDLIITNPPYGLRRVKDITFINLNSLRVHHFFAAKCGRLLKDNGIMAMIMPSFFLDKQEEHAREIMNSDGVNLICAYRLPDDLFADAKVTVDIVFLKKSVTGINWLESRKVKIGKYYDSLNEYFINHPQNILGRLEIVSMYSRKGLTCKANGELREQLKAAYISLANNGRIKPKQ